ncbi:hypothetical protein NLHDIDDJ_02449 [Acinetobacter baumannii]|uniref:DUF4055 domain-containing protein n=1 Tax=Acinetobacter baumannii TaxID=470 RepID=UPI001E5A6556|nr:DUF4055 domain-containing protein [Acinetobacter baumannii]UDY20794.1 hypothetical protein NLHDIDDJ_02449 [Acinetobacter baumannii]
MTVSTVHPDYAKAMPDWEFMDYALGGERCVKEQGEKLLPKSQGMIMAEEVDPKNKCIYEAFKQRAEYPEWVRDSKRAMIGLVSKLEPDINIVDSRLKPLIEQATTDGFGLKQLFLRVVEAQLSYARCALMLDFDDSGKPYIALYWAKDGINWKEKTVAGRTDLTLSVFKEAHDNSEDEFAHNKECFYRALDINDGKYRSRLFADDNTVIEETYPGLGNKALSFIPVVYVGSMNNTPSIDEMPLMTMAKAAVKYYQLSAEYFQELHLTSHPQPWVSGVDEDKPLRVTGPMAAWQLPQGGQCGYLEIQGVGIEAKRTAMRDQKNAALEAGARVMDIGGAESGEARKARQDDQYSTLYGMVITAAEAIEQVIKYGALWLGLNDKDYRFNVKPDFGSLGFDVNLAKQLYEAVLGNKISMETYWDYIRTGKIPDIEYSQELERIETEMTNSPMTGYVAGVTNGNSDVTTGAA